MQQKDFFRIAHLTDIHLNGEAVSEEGLIKCLSKIHSLKPLPDLIINGGDSIRDALKDNSVIVASQWGKFSQIFKDHCLIPVKHVLGNHDVFAGTSIAYGKKQALQVYGLTSAYYSFSHSGWKFIVLDSTSAKESGEWYEARLDKEQFRWLELETQSEQPICIISHIPILSAAAFLDGENVRNGEWIVPGAWMHLDVKRMVELFSQRPSVKLCLSGHLHLQEKVEYNGVNYLCNGAVSGNWWKGGYQQTPPGFALLDLYPDGKFDHVYLNY